MSPAELDRLARAHLLTVRAPGHAKVAELVAVCEPAQAAYVLSGLTWQTQAAAAVELARTAGLRLIVPGDPDWPAVELNSVGLWVSGRGHLSELSAHAVGMAGSVAATPYGTQVAAGLAAELAQVGWTVVTLGRFGIDSAALRGTLRRTRTAEIEAHRAGAVRPPEVAPLDTPPAPTVVLPLGRLAAPGPPAHAELFRKVGWDGLLVSEHGTRPPDQETAADRHRQGQLMAALVRALVLVEPGWGSRWLVDAAKAAGVPVLAVPGPVGSQQSEGAHELIRTGRARLVTGYSNVLAELEGSR